MVFTPPHFWHHFPSWKSLHEIQYEFVQISVRPLCMWHLKNGKSAILCCFTRSALWEFEKYKFLWILRQTDFSSSKGSNLNVNIIIFFPQYIICSRGDLNCILLDISGRCTPKPPSTRTLLPPRHYTLVNSERSQSPKPCIFYKKNKLYLLFYILTS